MNCNIWIIISLLIFLSPSIIIGLIKIVIEIFKYIEDYKNIKGMAWIIKFDSWMIEREDII